MPHLLSRLEALGAEGVWQRDSVADDVTFTGVRFEEPEGADLDQLWDLVFTSGRSLARFFHVEAAGGVVLLVATLTALALANSPLADGFLAIVDRIKDMLLRGGENVYCAEVEAGLFEHPDVTECAVFGVPDERLGEEVGAAIVVRDGVDLAADALREHCASFMAAHKIPRYIWLRTQPLPRNANGKFLKRQLRDELDPRNAV